MSPRPLPDGKGFVFVRRDGGRFQLAFMDFATRQVQVLTAGPGDESPSIAPNGKLIIYAAEAGGRGILAAVSSDGRVKQRLVAPARTCASPRGARCRDPEPNRSCRHASPEAPHSFRHRRIACGERGEARRRRFLAFSGGSMNKLILAAFVAF